MMEAAITPTTIGTYLCVPPFVPLCVTLGELKGGGGGGGGGTAHKWETIITHHAWFPNVTT